MKNALTKWASPTYINLKQQWKKINSYSIIILIRILVDSNLKHLAPSIRHSLLYIQTTLLLVITNLQLISLNVHFSSHHIFICMDHNSPIIYHPWPYKAKPFFKFKNGGMPFVLPSTNICKKNKRWQPYNRIKAGNYDIPKFLLPPDAHYKYVTAKETFEEFSRALRVHIVKDTTIS